MTGKAKDGDALKPCVSQGLDCGSSGLSTAGDTERMILDLVLALNNASTIEAALSVIANAALRIPPVDSGGIYLFYEARSLLRLVHHFGLPDTFVAKVSDYGPEAPQVQLVMQGRVLFGPVEDFVGRRIDQIEEAGIRAMGVIPVRHDGQIVGAVNVATHDAAAFTSKAQTLLQVIAAHIGGVLRRIRAENEARRTRENLQTFFDTTAEMLFVLNSEGAILEVNEAAAAALEYERQELTSKRVTDLHPAHLRDEVTHVMDDMLKGRTTECLIPLVTRTGREIPAETRVSRGVWNGCDALFGISRDIAERKQAEEALNRLNATLEQRVRSRTMELEAHAQRLSEEICERKRAQQAYHAVSRRLSEVRDVERRQIARELHDSVAQGLVAISMNLGLLEDSVPAESADVGQLVAGSLTLCEKCLQEVRTLSYLLHPPLLDQLGLGPALQSYVDGFSKRSGIRVAVDVTPDFPRISADVELALFRVMQESLGNIHRHAGSDTARIRLACDANAATIEVADDGAGIPPAKLAAIQKQMPCGGIGIAGMQERLRLLDGELVLESDSRGTTVRATVPIGRTPQ